MYIEGQWIFDEERGACVGIERTETFNLANSINFAFGTSLDAMDDVIVCD